MFHITVSKSYDELSNEAFKVMKDVIDGDHTPVLGLATGSSPVGLYQLMIKDHQENGTSYKDIITFNLDEYIGLPRNHEGSYWTFMHEHLFNHIDIPAENIHVPLGSGEDPEADCVAYEEELSKYTIDIQVLGVGTDGHIAFDEPGSSFDSVTRVTTLNERTRRDNARFFGGNIDKVPKQAVTVGLANIIKARKIIMIATGENKADAVKGMLEGEMSPDCPASILQSHPEVYVFLDEAAASKLSK